MIENFINRIICGDTFKELQNIPDETVQMCMTSPPYWSLRDYKIEDQIGLEANPLEYLEKIWAIFDEIKRVLKKDGVIFVNYGDTYWGSPECLTGKGIWNYKPKCLCMIPERFAIGMVDRGWILRNRICWHKPNAMPSSVKDRFATTWEYIYMFSKSNRYYFDLDAVREPLTESSIERMQYPIDKLSDVYMPTVKSKDRKKIMLSPNNQFNYRVRDAEKKNEQCPQFKASKEEIENYKDYGKEHDIKTGKLAGEKRDTQQAATWKNRYDSFIHPLGKNPGDCWDIATHSFSESHFATFPEKLCRRPILSSSRPGDIVLDPFSGSGTVAVVALYLGRKYLGIELNPDYIAIAERRIQNEVGLLKYADEN